MASGKGEALFTIIARNEYDLVGLASTSDLPKLAVGQPATIRIIGIGDVDARVRRIAPTVEPAVQLGPVYHRHHHQPEAAGQYVAAAR